jgi:hypothetical protein
MSIGIVAGTFTAAGLAASVSTVAAVGTAAYSLSQGGSSGSGVVSETAQGRQAAEMALDQYKTYVTDFKPTEEKFIADVMKPTTTDEAKQMGKVNADIAQKSAIPAGDPNRLIRNPGAFSDAAGYMGTSQTKAEQAVQGKQVASEQAVVDIGLGKASSAQLGMDSLASDAQKTAIANKQTSVNNTGNIINSIGSAAGAVGAVAKNWPTSSWNGSNGTIDNYDPYTAYSGNSPGPYAIQPITTEV